MTVFTVILCILAFLLLIAAIILLLPIKVAISLKEDFHIKAYLGFIKVYNSDKEKENRKKKDTLPEKPRTETEKADGFPKRIFKTIKERR